MHKFTVVLAALISFLTIPTSVFAEKITAETITLANKTIGSPSANDSGYYIDLPTIDYRNLHNEISTINNQLSERELEIKHYLDKHRLNSKDALITAIMPGGLLYAAVRKGNLDQARTELDKITEYKDELSHDLLATQAMLNTHAVAHLNQ